DADQSRASQDPGRLGPHVVGRARRRSRAALVGVHAEELLMASSPALPLAGGIRRRLDRGALVLPGLAILTLGFLMPLALLLPQSLQDPDFGLGAYGRLFGES